MLFYSKLIDAFTEDEKFSRCNILQDATNGQQTFYQLES